MAGWQRLRGASQHRSDSARWPLGGKQTRRTLSLPWLQRFGGVDEFCDAEVSGDGDDEPMTDRPQMGSRPGFEDHICVVAA